MNTNSILAGARTLLSILMKPKGWKRAAMSALPLLPAGCLVSAVLCPLSFAWAGAFSGDAGVGMSDPSGGLSWNSTTNALTVQCWFKVSVPSGVSLSDNMTILVNLRTGTTNDPHAYHIWYDKAKGSIEFSTRWGAGTAFWQGTLIARPLPDRWYHIAVVRVGSSFTAYIDGTVLPTINGLSTSAGLARTTNGVTIGCLGTGKFLYGEVQEVSIYQGQRGPSSIRDYMFQDQDTNDVRLKGYFKLGFSQNPGDRTRNLASAAPPNTDGTVTNSGAIAYEETDQAGEQSSFDAGRNGGAGAIAPLGGSFYWEQAALTRPTPGIPFSFQIGYGSANAAGRFLPGETDPSLAGPLENRWRHSLETRVLSSDYFGDSRTIGLLLWNGSLETWDRIGDSDNYQTRRRDYRGRLFDAGTNHVWVTPEHLVYTFRARDTAPSAMQGRLVSITDSNHNQVLLQYNGTGELTNVVDSSGGQWAFNYRGDSLLQSVSLGAWSVKFDYDANLRLISKTLTNSSGLYTNVPATWRFIYYTNGPSSNLLQCIVDPRGNTNMAVSYDEYGRRIGITNAVGRSTRVAHGVPGKRQITTTDTEGFLWIDAYDRNGRPIAQQDPLGNVSRSTYDERGNRTSATDPLGHITWFGYDDRANLTAITNALGQVIRHTFHAFFNRPTADTDALGCTRHYEIDDATGNVLRLWDDLGTAASYTYTSNGLVATYTDANGDTTRFAYANGFRVEARDAAGCITRFNPNELGWNLEVTNALGEVTTYAYDLNGKVVLNLDALSRARAATYDGNGNLVAQTDAKGQLMRYDYDALNQKTNEVDRAGAARRFTYTPRGKPASVINALNQTNAFAYDAANRSALAVDAQGNSVTTVYDRNGNAIAAIDKLGRRWARTFDRLNRVVAEADPFGNTTQTIYDAAGRVRETVAPNGSRTINAYDVRGRLTNWVDAAGSRWHYNYDGVGNITNITDALGGRYAMEYDVRNERIRERNQDGKEWRYTYDALERVKTQRDPDGTERTLTYDAGGRVSAVNFSTGRVNSFLYDDNDNPVVLSRSGSGPATISQLGYDPLDRIQQYTDAFAKTIRYAYDAAGRLTNLTYPDGKTLSQRYDALGRLTNQVFQFGPAQTFTNTYDYDKKGHLTRRTYPNGMVQTNTFDSAGRLTGLSHCPLTPQPATLNVALNYAYDRNGNTSASREQGTFRWTLPTLRDESSRFTAAGRITNRVDALAPTNNFTYQHDENGNMTNAFGAGQTWTLTYDEDNRTTSISWRNGALNDVTVTNRYDALGRRIAKTVDGSLTGYVLHLAGGMERILCDLSGARAISAWYVHGPDLAFKVTPDGSLTCYHADAKGNIIALTDAGKNIVAQYAYTPYGRSLGSTNSPAYASNPYLYVGSQGVMEELPSLYFMRARYYSAEAGVFLSTEPIRHVGPTWRPIAHAYARGNPLKYTDPKGEWAVLDNAWSAIKDFGVDVWNEVKPVVGAAWEKVKPVAGEIWKEIKASGQDLWERLVITPYENLKRVPEDLKELGEYLWGAAKDLWESVTDKQWWVEQGQWFVQTGEDIARFVTHDLVPTITQVWQQDIQPVLEQGWEGVKSVAKTVWDWIF